MTIDARSVPRRVDGYAVEQLDAEVLLYDAGRTIVVYLNQTALLVWGLCDGRRRAGEIADLLVAAYPDAAAAVMTDVQAALTVLAGYGVVEFAASNA